MIDPRLEGYIESHTTPESELLYELRRKTFLHTPYPRMLSGPVQGRFLEMISRMIGPSRILEIGTFTGYSAVCLAQGLVKDGILHTIEAEGVYAEMAREYFAKAGLTQKIILHEGDALNLLPGIDETFDLVFIDAAKEHYVDYYRLVFDKVKMGGFILADNTLWDGKVLEERPGDLETRGIVEFNKMVQEDQRVENVLLSLRDGLTVIRKHAATPYTQT
ncbi:MAG: class I SAM-dependent methyltransferase [Bacteroidales bacterium]|jgi:predicted O-methyltransferase YrrM|nr:class I SAM-dependent methyltransferase [Bacteroidales bacterium]